MAHLTGSYAETPRSRENSPQRRPPSSSPWSTSLSKVCSDFACAQPSSEHFGLKIPDETHTCMHIFVLPAAGKQCSSSSREAQLADEHPQLAARRRFFRLQWPSMDRWLGWVLQRRGAKGGSRRRQVACLQCSASICSGWRLRGHDSCSRVQLSRTRGLHESSGCSGQQWLDWDTTLATL